MVDPHERNKWKDFGNAIAQHALKIRIIDFSAPVTELQGSNLASEETGLEFKVSEALKATK